MRESGGGWRCVTERWRLPPSPSVALLKVKVSRPSLSLSLLYLSLSLCACARVACLCTCVPARQEDYEGLRREGGCRRRSVGGRERGEGWIGVCVGGQGCVPGVARARCPVFIALANRSIADSDTAQLGSPRTELSQSLLLSSTPTLFRPCVLTLAVSLARA